ncbi:MAG: ABC transporter permease [Pirellulaceae bacterium]
MPINDLGYRNWDAKPTLRPAIWTVITKDGIRLAWRHKWLRRLIVLSWVPAFVLGIFIFLFEQAVQNKAIESELQGVQQAALIVFMNGEIDVQALGQAHLMMGDSDQFQEILSRVMSKVGISNEPDIQDLRKPIELNREVNQPSRGQRRRSAAQSLLSPSSQYPVYVLELLASQLNTNSYDDQMRVIKINRIIKSDADKDGLVTRDELVDELRPRIWSRILFNFFKFPQGIALIIVIGIVAPKLIAHDVRSRAFLLYFSKPIKPWQYLLGKIMVVATYVAAITTLPAFILYFIGIALSPGLSSILATWHVPFQIILASVVLCVPATIIALCFSSLTSQSRIAGFAWFMVWIIGNVAFMIMFAVDADQAFRSQQQMTQQQIQYESDVNNNENLQGIEGFRESSRPRLILNSLESEWTVLSLFHTIWKVEAACFGFADEVVSLSTALTLLLIVTFICFFILRKRITAPIRV